MHRYAMPLSGAILVVAVITAMLASTPTLAAVPQGCLPGSLKSTLSVLQKKFGKLTIISTHRPGARIRGSGKRSLHASCRAVDFHPPRGKYKAVLAWLKRNHPGGIGTYSGRFHHIHIDAGPRTRWHKSY